MNHKSYPNSGMKTLDIVSTGNVTLTDKLLNTVMYHQTLKKLYLDMSPIPWMTLADFVITNKNLTILRMHDAEGEEDTLLSPEIIRIFGAMQLNWSLIGIDWFTDYYYSSFDFGSMDYVCERFLVEKIMDRNKMQQPISAAMGPVIKEGGHNSFHKISDLVIFTQE